eukprot:Seg821.17 transcript_id=Seg821.17/GoldUCD/mRNA.D3Y31 product="alpha-2 adrenergic receptor" protein_id=Seg821.17/GoldUCD/D3Y31
MIIFTAVTENTIVLYTIISKSRLHRPAYCLNAALALSDLLIVLLGGCSYVPIIAFGRIEVCGLKPAIIVIHGTFTITTSLLLCLITRDRYLCIQSSRAATPHATKRKNILLALLCFLVSLVLSSAVLLEFWVSWFSARELYSGLFSMAFMVIAIYYQKLRKLVKEHENCIRSSKCDAKDHTNASIQMNHPETCPQQSHRDTSQQPNLPDRSQETNIQNTSHERCHQDTTNDCGQRNPAQKQQHEDLDQEMNHLDMDSKQSRQERAHTRSHQDTGKGCGQRNPGLEQQHDNVGQEMSHLDMDSKQSRQDRAKIRNHQNASPQLHHQNTSPERNHRDTDKQKAASSRRRSSINSSIIMLVASFAFAYFPFAIVFTIHTINERVFGKTDLRVSHAFVWANSFGYLNAVIDPLIYAFRCDPIGKELRKFVYSARRKMFGTLIEPHSETV